MLKTSLYISLLVIGIGFLNISAQTGEIKSITKGVVNGSAISLPKPVYPAAVRAVRASGAVNVQVTIDEEGSVISATAVSGHPLLRASAEQAARAAKFKPTLLSGVPVKVTGVIVYNFVPPPTDEKEESPEMKDELQEEIVMGRMVDSDAPPVLNKSAVVLPKPAYPLAAIAVHADGAVSVQVTVDEDGNVASAKAVSGHPLLRQSAEQAALKSKFKPTVIDTQAVKLSGIIVYNFILPTSDQADPVSESKEISAGVVNGKALSLPKPPYPRSARYYKASGAVNVKVVIDEEGNVISATAVSGHELLREASEQAARLAKFSPTLVEGKPVKVSGVIVYNFVP